ncbi:MAG: hypothetical protein IKT00_07885 [Prevotella sp.]|nr:hypothetical protein [Prevotella sp.]
MKRLTAFLSFVMFAAVVWAQDVTYQVKYKYSYDMQNYQYIDSLDYAEGTVVKIGDAVIVVNGERYEVTVKDGESYDGKRVATQYTTHNAKDEEFIICFVHELSFPDELAHQVIIFNANNPYVWQYYITDEGKNS